MQTGSAASDAIPIADCTDQSSTPLELTSDQRGYPRPDSEDSPPTCDVGAYELQDASSTSAAAFTSFNPTADLEKPQDG